MKLTSTHWGAYEVESKDGRVVELKPFAHDIDPSPIGQSVVGLLDHKSRIRKPAIRKSWLEKGPGASPEKRGSEPFVEVDWDEAARLLGGELDRVRNTHGNKAIFGGSYGWASAGRFHHAQSQLHRFLNSIGGFTRSVNTYSYAAAEVIMPQVMGNFTSLLTRHNSWRNLVENCDLMVCFGGLALDNGQISNGGTGRHIQSGFFEEAWREGVRFVNVSPRKFDVKPDSGVTWLAVYPNSDVALMLALCYTLRSSRRVDEAFIEDFTSGYDKFCEYLDGVHDGVPKNAKWAADLCGLKPSQITQLAHEMSKCKCMINVSWSLTRQQYGEQPYWAAVCLAAMLGQIGSRGGGIGFGYGIANHIGNNVVPMTYATLPQYNNPITDFIPVARLSDMLLNPGGTYEYNGAQRTYPDIKMIYWAGGNPFHHHQDLNKLMKAWTRPDTIVMHDWCWNAAVKRADVVLPCTTSLEREDVGMTPRDPFAFYMHKAAEAPGEAIDDFEIFTRVARAMGVEKKFTDGRTSEAWVRWMWEKSTQWSKDVKQPLCDFDTLKEHGFHENTNSQAQHVMMWMFRKNARRHKIGTPSGRIEMYSEKLSGLGIGDCPAHPTWMEPDEWLGNATPEFPLHLLGRQPRNKLHSQFDPGQHSQADKVEGREPLEMSVSDAQERGIEQGDIVKVTSSRGSCLCGAIFSRGIKKGVVTICTGSWFDPVDPAAFGEPLSFEAMCKHGNPNVLTPDRPTSLFGQGPAPHSCLVSVEKYEGPLPEVTAFDPPELLARDAAGEAHDGGPKDSDE